MILNPHRVIWRCIGDIGTFVGGVGGHENYGLFPQFGTFSFWHAPLTQGVLDGCDSLVWLVWFFSAI